MICPKCSAQCEQYHKIGTGTVEEDFYDTSEAKVCPSCNSVYIEYYADRL